MNQMEDHEDQMLAVLPVPAAACRVLIRLEPSKLPKNGPRHWRVLEGMSGRLYLELHHGEVHLSQSAMLSMSRRWSFLLNQKWFAPLISSKASQISALHAFQQT